MLHFIQYKIIFITEYVEWEKPEIKSEIQEETQPKIKPETQPKIKPETLTETKVLTSAEVFKNEQILQKHRSFSGYIHGTKNGHRVVKVFLKYKDEKAKSEIKETISEGLTEEFIIIPDKIKEIKQNMAPFTDEENSSPAVDETHRTRLCKIISEQAEHIYKNHSDVFGLRISNVRCVDGRFVKEPCIVIYCIDKSFTPTNEKQLPVTLEGYPCDIRENIIMFGGGASLGSTIGNPFNLTYGSIGFLVKSNVPSMIPDSGFLTAAHVAIKELDKLHKENALLSQCKQKFDCNFARRTHCIVQPAWPFSDSCKRIGEVVESFCGNYKPCVEDNYNLSFGMDAAFINTYQPKPRGKTF